MLSFLTVNNPPTNTQSNITPPDQDDIDNFDNSMDEGTLTTTVTAEPCGSRAPPRKKKCNDHVGQQLVTILKESAEERRRQATEQTSDEDRLFLLSLVSDLKKVPDHLKLSVRRQIISVIEHNTPPHPSRASSSASYETESYNTNYSQGYNTDYGSNNNRFINQYTSPPQSTADSEQSNRPTGSPIFTCFN